MEVNNKATFKEKITLLISYLEEAEGVKSSISELKKEIKKEFDIPIPTITKVATILRKKSIQDETEKWDEITEIVSMFK